MSSVIQNSTPVETVKAFLACVRTKDVETMRKVIHPRATACLIRDIEPRFQTLNEAIDRLQSTEQELVETTAGEIEQVDGNFATVWATFNIHMDGKHHQTGSVSYSCWKDSEVGWLILSMTDIARSPNDNVLV